MTNPILPSPTHTHVVSNIRNYNLSATVDPAPTDDAAAGYEIGSVWIVPLTSQVWVCTDATVGSAVWVMANGEPVNINRSDFVDAQFGSASGVRQDLTEPFATLAQGAASASGFPGDTVYVQPACLDRCWCRRPKVFIATPQFHRKSRLSRLARVTRRRPLLRCFHRAPTLSMLACFKITCNLISILWANSKSRRWCTRSTVGCRCICRLLRLPHCFKREHFRNRLYCTVRFRHTKQRESTTLTQGSKVKRERITVVLWKRLVHCAINTVCSAGEAYKRRIRSRITKV